MTNYNKSNEEWKKVLDPELYHIAREKGTELPFSGKYIHVDDDGMFSCAVCDNELFSSKAKYDSGSGWPSFFETVSKDRIETATDRSHGMERIEVMCARCHSHLGHIFPDGPGPTGQRYCINSRSLSFKKD